MRTLIALVLLGFPCLLGAQQIVMPPSADGDGSVTHTPGLNASSSFWGSPSSLAAYAVSGDSYQDPLSPGAADQHLGLTWTSSAPASLAGILERMNATGGSVRVIFIGESAGWLDSFGYTYTGDPTAGHQSFTAWKEIQSYGFLSNISFGDYFDVALPAGSASHFDFWYSAAGQGGSSPSYKTEKGGLYTLFHNSSLQSLWASQPLPVETSTQLAPAGVSVDSYLVSFEDWRLASGSDADYSDLRIALQFYNPDGSALAIPEPASCAFILGTLGLLGALGLRCRRARHS